MQSNTSRCEKKTKKYSGVGVSLCACVRKSEGEGGESGRETHTYRDRKTESRIFIANL